MTATGPRVSTHRRPKKGDTLSLPLGTEVPTGGSMPDPASPFEHRDLDKKDDETLRDEAKSHLARRPELQLVAELLTKLRAMALPWWTPESLRERWPAGTRLGWLRDRADLRQQITVALTGLAPKAARRLAPSAQAALVDAVLDEGDVSHAAFEKAHDPADLAVYGPAAEVWREMLARMPWEQDTPEHQELIAWLLRALLSSESAFGPKRKPILTSWDVRTRIEGHLWHTHIPLEIRVAIDEARHAREKEHPRKPFLAVDDLAIATPEVLTENIPLRELMEIFLAAETAMGFSPPPPPAKEASGATGAQPAVPVIPKALGGSGEDAADSGPAEPMTVRKPLSDAPREVVIATAGDGAEDVVSSAAQAPAAPPPSTRAPGAEGADEDDLARTNQWATPNVDDLWTNH